MKKEHYRLQGIYDEPPQWKEFFGAVVVLGIPFALLVALIFKFFNL